MELTRDERLLVIDANAALPCIGPSWHNGCCTDHVDKDDPLCCTGCRYREIRDQLDAVLALV